MQGDDIVTPRLCLRVLREDVLELCLTGNRARAEAALGCAIPDDWYEPRQQDFMAMRILQRRGDAAYAPFGPRAMVLRKKNVGDRDGAGSTIAYGDRDVMIGHIGFHTAPDPAYLAATVGRGIEVGYTVFAAYRRLGMIGWAHAEHAVTQFVASIAPENRASQNLAAKLGFTKVGEQVDEIDGPEDVLLLRLPT